MELRHLRYFVAVAEEGSLTVAAERRLHTAQPSLSRQIRDLEYEVGVKLMTRSARGIALTAAGQAFLDHARLALAQTDMAVQAARRAAQPDKPSFSVGFLTGHEMILLPEVMKILRDELPKIDVTISSQSSPQLADGLMQGRLDLAFMRREPNLPELVYKIVMQEKLMVVMPSDHRLASRKAIAIADVAQETFIGMSKTAPSLQVIIEDYLRLSGLDIRTQHEVDNLSMAISLVASTRGVTLLPAYAENFLPWSVISRPLAGEAPTIDLVIGYHTSNTSPILKFLLIKCNELILRVNNKLPTT